MRAYIAHILKMLSHADDFIAINI